MSTLRSEVARTNQTQLINGRTDMITKHDLLTEIHRREQNPEPLTFAGKVWDQPAYGAEWVVSEWFPEIVTDTQRRAVNRLLHSLRAAGLVETFSRHGTSRMSHVRLTDAGRRELGMTDDA